MITKIFRIARQEITGLHVRLLIAQIVIGLLPPFVGSRVRSIVLRAAGFRIGEGTLFWGKVTITGTDDLTKRLTIGKYCWFNHGCSFELGAAISIGDRVSVGQEVMILTNAHHIGGASRRAGLIQSGAVTIGDGAWLSTRCTIMPGVTIGSGAVVAAGAVVVKSVAPNEMVGGVPARTIRQLSEEEVGQNGAVVPHPSASSCQNPTPTWTEGTQALYPAAGKDRSRMRSMTI